MHTQIDSAAGTSSIGSRATCGGGAVSWAAIFAGAVSAAVLSLILLVLGAGLGFASVSPWRGEGLSAGNLGISAILWITFMSIAASGIGGYIAGRLRSRWTSLHHNEVYFRDTAHGFLAWGVATLLTASLLTSAVGNVISGGAKIGAAAVGGVAASAAAVANSDVGDNSNLGGQYFLDQLLRPSTSGDIELKEPSDQVKREVATILANAVRTQSLPDDDERYLIRVLAKHTGISEQEARARINDVYAKLKELEVAAKEAADKAASASAYASLWLFISLLIGAFVASLMATYGGRCRDTY